MILTDSVQTVQLAAPGEEFSGECLETGWSLLTGTVTGLSLLIGTAGHTRGGVHRGVSRDRLASTHRYSNWLVSRYSSPHQGRSSPGSA